MQNDILHLNTSYVKVQFYYVICPVFRITNLNTSYVKVQYVI